MTSALARLLTFAALATPLVPNVSLAQAVPPSTVPLVQLTPQLRRFLWEKLRYTRPYAIDWTTGFSEGFAEVEVKGRWGFIDRGGRTVVEPQFDQATPFRGGLACVRAGSLLDQPDAALAGLSGTWRFIDHTGARVARGPYNICLPFSEGLAVVSVGRYACGFATPNGELVIPGRFRQAQSFSEGLASVFVDRDGKTMVGYVDARGTEVIPPQFAIAGAFSRGRALVRKRDRVKIINARGEDVAALDCDHASDYRFFDGFAAVAKGEMWGLVNDSGVLVVPYQFEFVGRFSEGLVAVAREGKLGFINANGEFVIEPQFDAPPQTATELGASLCVFSDGLAAVSSGGKWGYISHDGEWIIEPHFDQGGAFTEGVAKVAVGNRLGYIDRAGKYIWEPTR